MAILLNDNIRTSAPLPSDYRFGPYATVAGALSSVLLSERYIGLTVGVGIGGTFQEYWFKEGLADGNLIVKTADVGANLFLSLTGGTISQDLTVTGNLSVLGNTTQIDTTIASTSSISIDTNSSEVALRITQRGSGDVLRVEDQASDTTPFVINADGNVGIKTNNVNNALTVNGNVSASGSLTVSGNISAVGTHTLEAFSTTPSVLAIKQLNRTTNTAQAFEVIGGYNFSGFFPEITLFRVKNNGSIEEGISTSASGDFGSHAEGYQTTATGGSGSHSEGERTSASGAASHSEGSKTIASGFAAHAEGQETLASGYAAHAEGGWTRAIGGYSHAAGRYAEARHDRTWIWKGSTDTNILSTTRANQFMVSAAGGSAFFGNVGIGTDNNSNALTVAGALSAYGTHTLEASSINPTLTIRQTDLNGDALRVINIPNIGGYGSPTSETSFSITSRGGLKHGKDTVINGLYSLTQGYQTSATGYYSSSFGEGNNAIGQSSHSEGRYGSSVGQASHVEGENGIALGQASHSEGIATIALGYNAHAQNHQTMALGIGSHSQGEFTVCGADYSSTDGSYTIVGRRLPFATFNVSNNTFTFTPENSGALINNFAIGGYYACIMESGLPGGVSTKNFLFNISNRNTQNGTITADNFIGSVGGYNTTSGYIVYRSPAPIKGARAEGFYTTAIGGYSHSEGYYTTASGEASHAEGGNNTSEGIYSHAEGLGTRAIGGYSHTEGEQTIARGLASHAEGTGTVAHANRSSASGLYATAAHLGSNIWKGSSLTDQLSTTRNYQFMVSADGGSAFFGNVGIGTDNNSNALTVAGLISANNISISNATIQTFTNPVTATGSFLVLNINGQNRAIRLWDFTT